MENKENSNKIVSYFVDFLFSKEKNIEKWLIVLIIIGFFLRLIAAINLNAFADDMVYASQCAGIMDSKIISTHSNPPLFFYLTDLTFKFFGYSVLVSRIWPLIFGTLLIPVSFLIARKFFGKNVAFLSAFLVTFSNFLIRMTYNEASLVVLFFSMFGAYLGIEYLEKRKLYFIILSGILFGLAALTKYSAPFFIFSFLVFSAYYLKINKEKVFTKKNIKILVLFLAIILLFSLPFLTFNYLLYKDKGIVDIYFSRIIQLNSTQQAYGSLLGQDQTFFDNVKNLGFYGNIIQPFRSDFILTFFALFGLFLLFIRKQKMPLGFILILLIIPYMLQSPGSPLQKHFAFLNFLFAIPAGFGLHTLLSKIHSLNLKKIALIIIALLMIINLGFQYGTPSDYFSKSEISQIKDFVASNINKNDLIVVDSRIYTAKSFWISMDNHFLSLQDFISFYNENKEDHVNNGEPTKVYVIECISDDCGWGWVPTQPEFNRTSEEILSSLKQQASLEKTITSNSYKNNELLGKQKIDVYNIYLLNINLDRSLVDSVDYYNSFYFVPYLYKNKSNYLFNYSTYNIFDSLLNKLSYYIILLSMILSFVIIILVIIFLNKATK